MVKPDMRYCEISKEMSLYFGLTVFCLFEAEITEFDTQPLPSPVQCTLYTEHWARILKHFEKQVQGFSLIVVVFLMIKHLIIVFRPLYRSVKIDKKQSFISFYKIVAYTNPVVLSGLWKDSSLRKVDFPASSKCLRIRTLVKYGDSSSKLAKYF
jgi:hypothetical protein